MVDTAIMNAIEKEIGKYRTRLQALEGKRKVIEAELPLVRGNLEALNRTLEILQGKKVEDKEEKTSLPLIPSASSQHDLRYLLKKNSSTDIAYSILKQDGKPLSASELFNRVKQKKPELGGKPSFTSGIYRLIKVGRVFKNYDGKIGLLEWEKV
jgi:hypothetical protein